MDGILDPQSVGQSPDELPPSDQIPLNVNYLSEEMENFISTVGAMEWIS